MSKVLTISIAAYNVERFIEHTLDSLMIKDLDKIEVLIEDDGGSDRTGELVKPYEEKYPDVFKLVHKENGGYGSTINKSIELATGKYFKQLDGDDWYDTDNLQTLVNELEKVDVDVIYTPFVHYYEVDQRELKTDRFEASLQGVYDLEEVINQCSNNLVMHTLGYRTAILKDNYIHITENCFYTDTEYALYPLAYSKTIFISHLPIYYYRIGRDEQSVSIPSRRKNYKMQLKVNDRLIKEANIFKNCGPNLKNYVDSYVVEIICAGIANYLLILDPSKEVKGLIKSRDKEIKKVNPYYYDKMYKTSKVIRLLRLSHYQLYRCLHLLKMRQMEKANMENF